MTSPANLTLAERREALHDIFDYDEVRELRLALKARNAELEKLKKKEGDLGLDSHHIRERGRVINGTDTEPGLLNVIVFEETIESDQADVFFDESRAIPETTSGEPLEEGEVVEADYEVVEAAPEQMFDGWLPTAELVEEARELLAKEKAGTPFEDVAAHLTGNEELRRTVLLVAGYGWGVPTREGDADEAFDSDRAPTSPQKGDKLKTGTDLRRSYEVVKVFDDRVEVAASSGVVQRPFVPLADLSYDTERGAWLTDVGFVDDPDKTIDLTKAVVESIAANGEPEGPDKSDDPSLEDIERALSGAQDGEEIPAPWDGESEPATAASSS